MQGNALASKNEVSFPDVIVQPVLWGYHQDLRQADKYKAIVDFDTGKLFSVVSQDYRLIRHETAIAKVEEALIATSDFNEFETCTEFYNDGGRMVRTYRFPNMSFEVVPGDMVCPKLEIVNSYDTSWGFAVVLGGYRVVCENGMVVFEHLFEVRKRHILEIEKLYVRKQVSTALRRFESQFLRWQEWTNRRLTVETFNQVMGAMKFGVKAREEIEVRIEQEAEDFTDNGLPIISLWGFYNVITWFISHKTVSLNHRVDLERRLRSAIAHL